jgi:hypothetical protein
MRRRLFEALCAAGFALLTACGDDVAKRPSGAAGGTPDPSNPGAHPAPPGPARPRPSFPETAVQDLVAGMAAPSRPPSEPAADAIALRRRLEEALAAAVANVAWRVDVRAYDEPSAGGSARVRSAEAVPRVAEGTTAPWLRLESAGAGAGARAATWALYLAPQERAGYWVRPVDVGGRPAFRSNLDDPAVETIAWRDGETVVAASGFSLEALGRLRRALAPEDVPADPIPAAPVRDAPAAPSGSDGPAGTYELDRDALSAMARNLAKDAPPEAAKMAEEAEKMLLGMRLSLRLEEDGTFSGRLESDAAGFESSVRGTWTHRGATVTLTTTEEDGERRDPPDVKTATYADGRLTVTERPGQDLVLKRIARDAQASDGLPRPPFPPLSAETIARIRATIRALKMEDAVKRAHALLDEAREAKRAGDEESWQALLRGALGHLDPILDAWAEIEASMPSTKDYDESQVAQHYFGNEMAGLHPVTATHQRIRKMLRPQ